MADSQHTAGIRYTGDASGAVDAAKKVADENKKLGDQLGKTGEQAKKNAEESKRFVDNLRNQANELGKTRAETERYRASQHQLTDAQKASVDQSIKQIQAYERLERQKVLVARAATVLTTVMLATGAASVKAATDSEEAGNRMLAVLRATGFQAGLTKRELDDMASSMQAAFGFDDEDISRAQAELLKFGNIHGQVFRDAMKLSADLARFMGTDIPSAAQMIGRSLQSPTEGIMMMERNFGKLTAEQERHIESLVKQGRAVEAQTAVLTLWGQKVGGTAELMNTGLKKASNDLATSWDSLLESMGRSDRIGGVVAKAFSGVASALREVQQELDGTGNKFGSFFGRFSAERLAELPGGLGLLGKLGLAMSARDRAATAAGKTLPAGITLDDWMEPGPTGPITLGGTNTNNDQAAAQRAAEWKRWIEQREEAVREAIAKEGKARVEADEKANQAIIEHNARRDAEIAEVRRRVNEENEKRELEQIERVNKARTDAEEAAAKAAIEAQQKAALEAQRAWERTADNIERSLIDGIINGGRNGLELLQRAMKAAILTPIIQPIVRPMAQAGASAGQGLGGMFGFPGVPGFGGGMFGGGASAGGTSSGGWIMNGGGIAGMGSQFFADFGNFFGNVGSVTETGAIYGLGDATAGFLGANPWLPWIGPAMQFLGGDTKGGLVSAGLTAAGFAIGGPVGGAIGATIGGLMGGGKPKDRRASSGFTAGFGQDAGWGAFSDGRYISNASHGAALLGFGTQQATAEQNLIRNLNLRPDQVAAVEQALGRTHHTRHFFAEGKDGQVDPASLQQVAAARLQAISEALGRSIEELTQVMALSAEQWGKFIEQMESSVIQAEAALGQHVRALRGTLGITGLEEFQRGLGVAEFRSPLDRLSAARGGYEEMLAKARGGDLDAVRELPRYAQELLGIGRDVYASGTDFQDILGNVERSIEEVKQTQEDLLADITKDIAVTMLETSQNQIAAIRDQTDAMVQKLDELRIELERQRRV